MTLRKNYERITCLPFFGEIEQIVSGRWPAVRLRSTAYFYFRVVCPCWSPMSSQIISGKVRCYKGRVSRLFHTPYDLFSQHPEKLFGSVCRKTTSPLSIWSLYSSFQFTIQCCINDKILTVYVAVSCHREFFHDPMKDVWFHFSLLFTYDSISFVLPVITFLCSVECKEIMSSPRANSLQSTGPNRP